MNANQVNEIIHHFRIFSSALLNLIRVLYFYHFHDNKNKFKFKKKTTENIHIKKFPLIFHQAKQKASFIQFNFPNIFLFLCKLSFKKICLIVLFIYFYLQGFLIFQ